MADVAGGEQHDWKRIAVELRERLQRSRDRSVRLHRRILDTDVLRGSLPLRMSVLGSPTSAPDVAERERAFQDDHGRMLREGPISPGQRIVVDGLPGGAPCHGQKTLPWGPANCHRISLRGTCKP